MRAASRVSEIEREFGAKDFHTISTDTHIGDLVITFGGADENAAGTLHFEALLDQDLLIAGGNCVRGHPGRTATGGGSGGGIFSVVEKHARMQPGFGVDGLAGNEVKEPSSAAVQVFSGTILIEMKRLECVQRAQRGDGEWNSGGDGLDGSGLVEVSGGEAGDTRHGFAVVDGSEFGILLRHFAKSWKAGSVLETHGNGTDVEFKKDFAGAGLAAQNEGRAECRVTGEGQFFLHGEDADADAARLFRGGISGEDESCFREVGFARDRLHLSGREAASVEDDGQGIAGEGAVGKNIDLDGREFSRGGHGWKVR